MVKGTTKDFNDLSAYKGFRRMNNTTPSQKPKTIRLDGFEDDITRLFEGSNEFLITILPRSPYYDKKNWIVLAEHNQREIYDFGGVPLHIRSYSKIGENLSLRCSLYVEPRK